ncbi:MAG: DUF58 domain-containing protein [Lachnospiraceae bacterium]|nr:DUF58 domain-containing protein [Lachnospiraceae bacterium]
MSVIAVGLIAAILFYFQQLIYRNLWNAGVIVNLKFKDETVRAGEQTTLIEVLENHKWLPLPALKVKFQCAGELKFLSDHSSQVTDMYYRNDLFSLMPFKRITRKHQITCLKRGYYGIHGIDLVSADLFLTREFVESRSGETWLHVIPAHFHVPEIFTALKELSGEVACNRHLMTDPFAFRGIREYTGSDEMKTVNWKNSAKSDDLKVNVYDFTTLNTISIFVNLKYRELSGADKQLEKALGITAYLAEMFLSNGNSISLYSNGRDILNNNTLCMEEISDRGQLPQINKTLARLDLGLSLDDFELFAELISKKDNQMIVIISPDWLPEMQDFLLRVKENRNFMWLLPCRKGADVKVSKELVSKTMIIPDRD